MWRNSAFDFGFFQADPNKKCEGLKAEKSLTYAYPKSQRPG